MAGNGLCKNIWVRRRMGHKCNDPLRFNWAAWFNGNTKYPGTRVRVNGRKLLRVLGESGISWTVPPCCFRISNRKAGE